MLHVAFKIILRLVLIILSIVGFFIRPFLILYGYIYTPKRKLPPFRDSLLEIPAVDLAEKIRNREVKEEEEFIDSLNAVEEQWSVAEERGGDGK